MTEHAKSRRPKRGFVGIALATASIMAVAAVLVVATPTDAQKPQDCEHSYTTGELFLERSYVQMEADPFLAAFQPRGKRAKAFSSLDGGDQLVAEGELAGLVEAQLEQPVTASDGMEIEVVRFQPELIERSVNKVNAKDAYAVVVLDGPAIATAIFVVNKQGRVSSSGCVADAALVRIQEVAEETGESESAVLQRMLTNPDIGEIEPEVAVVEDWTSTDPAYRSLNAEDTPEDVLASLEQFIVEVTIDSQLTEDGSFLCTRVPGLGWNDCVGMDVVNFFKDEPVEMEGWANKGDKLEIVLLAAPGSFDSQVTVLDTVPASRAINSGKMNLKLKNDKRSGSSVEVLE